MLLLQTKSIKTIITNSLSLRIIPSLFQLIKEYAVKIVKQLMILKENVATVIYQQVI